METLTIVPGQLGLADLRRIWAGGIGLELAEDARGAVDRARGVIERAAARGAVVYGVTTGFGKLAQTRIPADRLARLQLNLLRSHAVGVGAPLGDDIIRLALALKANSLARGHSGVRFALIEALLALHNAGIVPVVPAKGSVGASGDLAPLAHMALPLIGEGLVRQAGTVRPARAALEAAGIAPVALEPKEAISLINGTQISTAIALAALYRGERLFASALVAGALSVDAARGSDTPFDARIQAARGQKGQMRVAGLLRNLLRGSGIRHSHLECGRVQDPYSLRCQPQVMGACLDQFETAAATLLREANAVSDNPLVFPEEEEVLSGGNFHAEPVAMAADGMALALAEIANMSERRIALLVDAASSGLPAFLVAEPGLNSGFMMPQVTAAALASENKILAHPASVDTIPTSANQEDHVSMATHGARRLLEMIENSAGVVAIELLAAAQGVELLRPLRSSAPLERALALVREGSAFLDQDRALSPEIERTRSLVLSATMLEMAGGAVFGVVG
ncbi:MAG: histidine ammonia-lyase [Alphaproteobacteria bacterium]|nr:histidine ammonia-lyase [Alphaproteobacteria bacterium]